MVAVDGPSAADAAEAGLVTVSSASASVMRDADVWVLAPGFLPIFHREGGFERIKLPGDRSAQLGKRVYMVEPDGFVHPLRVDASGQVDAPCTAENDPHLEQNIFVRMGSRNFRGAAYLFPYNGFYGGHPSAFGPIDEFGFRNAVDLRALERRSAGHIVVAVFGGSSVWSPCCLQSETFCSILERRLQEELKRQGSKNQVNVVNFGISGQTILNELLNYILFCHRLKPDVVIAHDLFNDLVDGLQTDPSLLNRNDITYLPAMEQWAQQLMGAAHVPLTQSSDSLRSLRVTNSPQAIVRAYLARKRQFSDLVEQSGAAFVWGTQPAWFAKPPAPEETERFDKIRAISRQLDPMYDALPQLYELARSAMASRKINHLVDVHGEFSSLTDSDDIFVDHVHTNPQGDVLVADIYCKALLSRNILKERSGT
ncbi:MAG: hypothetical protein AB7O50_08305 [Pseudolabrys sp.]